MQLLEKWKRRIARVNWDRIILKFSYQNECTDELVKEFLEINEYPKFCLVGESITHSDDEILYRKHIGKETVNETSGFNWHIDPIKILNARM